MPVDMTYELDQASSDAFFAQIDRAQRVLGKSTFASLQWAARLLCSSLGAQTKVAKQKLRPVVQNPDPRWQTDKRRARFGVMGYSRGKRKFIPIYRTGREGKRFYDNASASWYERADGRESGKWRKIRSGAKVDPALIVPSIMDHPRRKVPRRGLAKKAWQRARALVGRGGTSDALGVAGVASVFLKRSETDPTITLRNKLNYAEDALKGGPSSLSTAMEKAAANLEYQIGRQVDKALGIKT